MVELTTGIMDAVPDPSPDIEETTVQEPIRDPAQGFAAADPPPRPSALGVVVHPSRDVSASLATLVRAASARGVEVVARLADQDRLRALRAEDAPVVRWVPDDAFAAAVTGVIALGGDGTMLGALRLLADRPTPVLGVNHGNLGFLIELSPDQLEDALPRLVRGDFTIEPHQGLRVGRQVSSERSAGARGLDPAVAFNDVVLTRRSPPRATSVDLEVNGERYGYYRCDALVVATPTGSTAYNYAAGGPVLSPSLSGTVITPVAPMSGIARPVVLAADDVIALHVREDQRSVDVDLDGVPAGDCPTGGTVVIRSLPGPGQVVRLDAGAHGRARMLRLSLTDLPLRPDQLRELVPEQLRHHAP